MHRACDLLEVLLGGGAGESVATEPTSLFTSVKGLPLRAFTAPTPHPSQVSAPPGGRETGMGPVFYLRASGLFLLISHNPPGKEGEGSEGVLLAILHRGRLAVMEELCSVPCRTCPCPCPSAPGRSRQSNGLGRQREIPSSS